MFKKVKQVINLTYTLKNLWGEKKKKKIPNYFHYYAILPVWFPLLSVLF